jgi:hypothetical protein
MCLSALMIGLGGMADERDCRALASNTGRLFVLLASVHSNSVDGVEV